MFEDLGFSMSGIFGGVDAAINLIWILLLLAVLGGFIFFLYTTSLYKIRFRVRVVIHGRTIVMDDKAKEYKDKYGGIYLKLFKLKDKIPMPPPEAVEVDHKGRKCVEAYKLAPDQYIYAQDKAKVMSIPDKITQIEDWDKRQAAIEKWKKDNELVDAFQPLDTNDRISITNQVTQAQLKKTKKWQDYILPVVGIGACVIILVALMIFWGDLAKPVLDQGSQIAGWQKNMIIHAEILRDIKNDQQTIKNDIATLKEKDRPEEAPN